MTTQAMSISLAKETPRVPDRILDRDHEQAAAFESLVKRQTRFVFRVAHAMLRNSGDAEDVVQETFLKLHRNGAWKEVREERAFLASTAWRLALDKKRAQAKGNSLRVEVEQFDALRGVGPDPEQSAMAEDAISRLHCLMDALPEDLRQPLALSALEELNSREIAEVLGVKEGTVRTRLMRARQLLKEQLAAPNFNEIGGRYGTGT
jgi:RNA polymerase sigma-70 factor, ECF subfamily